MGEQPIFTTKAHVFQIDPNTKKKWLPASTQAVNVSYYYDSTRNSYRIISVEGSKAVINSTITPNMTFTKTSQKFGQWTDPRANTVYGLGFSSEVELAKFVEKFKEVKELTKQATPKTPPATTNGSSESNHVPPDSTSSPIPPNKSSLSNVVTQNSPQTENAVERRNSGSSVTAVQGANQEAQLKYENDRLKIALAQSSANAKKWEVELQTLKNNNARLTTALQESTSNVEEWKKQLAAYKEESARMKKKCVELEKSGGAGAEALQQQIRELTDKISVLESASTRKDEDIALLNKKCQDVEPLERQIKQQTENMKQLEQENDSLKNQTTNLQQQLEGQKTAQARDKQHLRSLQEQIGSKVSELNRLHEQITSALN